MTFEPLNIPISDNFSKNSWVNYVAYEKETAKYLPTQSHIDIRTFTSDSKEAWTLGTFGFQSTVEKFPGLNLKSSGSETMTSVSTVNSHSINLIEGFESTDYLTFALPNFPLSKVTTSASYLELSDGTNVVKVAFSESLTPIVAGDSEFKIARSLIEGTPLNLTAITTVKFIIKTTAVATIIIMGLKLVSKSWVYSSIDFDNWNKRLRIPTPTKGLSNKSPVFSQGPIWRSAPTPGINDPKPVDLSLGVSFNAGLQEKENELSLYFRQKPASPVTQAELEGIPMAELEGKPQPEFNSEHIPNGNPLEETWIRFTIKWGPHGIKIILCNSLYGIEESTNGYEVIPPENFTNSENYLLVGTLKGTTAKIQIYKLTSEMEVEQTPFYESPTINDTSTFHRNQGRYGWKATINDPSAFIRSIKQRSANFAEYISAPLPSFTPVDGAKLFSSFTANNELWNGVFNTVGSKVLVSRDTSRALTTAGSYKVITSGQEPNEGLITNQMEFLNFNQVEIIFSVWFSGPARAYTTKSNVSKGLFPGIHTFPGTKVYPAPKSVVETKQVENLAAQLISPEGQKIILTVPELEPEQWQRMKLTIPSSQVVQSGPYALEIIQPGIPTATWWIDAVSVYERAVQWSARSVTSDPWNSNYAPWIDFRDIVNINDQGISLFPRGKELQLRARALQQNATIISPKIMPRYAELGQLVWPHENRVGLVGPTAKFKTTSLEGKSVGLWEFTDESTQGTGAIGAREWDFGDGTRETGNLINVTHKYAKGTYHAYLSIVDRNGQHSVTKTKTITAL